MAPRIGGVRLVHEGWARYLVAEVMQDDGTRITREMEDHGRAVVEASADALGRPGVRLELSGLLGRHYEALAHQLNSA